jgi:hypothetical protein
MSSLGSSDFGDARRVLTMLGSNDLGIVTIARSRLVEVAATQCKGESS